MKAARRRSTAILRGGLLVVLALVTYAALAWGVSGSELKDVVGLDCDLESAPQEFRLQLNRHEHTLQLQGETRTIPFKEVSDGLLRFRFAPPGGPELSCDLEMPAGALSCRDRDGAAQVGFCLLAP